MPRLPHLSPATTSVLYLAGWNAIEKILCGTSLAMCSSLTFRHPKRFLYLKIHKENNHEIERIWFTKSTKWNAVWKPKNFIRDKCFSNCKALAKRGNMFTELFAAGACFSYMAETYFASVNNTSSQGATKGLPLYTLLFLYYKTSKHWRNMRPRQIFLETCFLNFARD